MMLTRSDDPDDAVVVISCDPTAAVNAFADVARALSRFAATVTRVIAVANKLTDRFGDDGDLAGLRAYARRYARYERHCHSARPRRPYRHGRVGVR